jgi:hypothetical protein
LEPIKDNIKPIEGEFGEESVFEDLEEKLNELECIWHGIMQKQG